MFKFGPKFQILVNTVMKNTQSCVHNGGWVSSSFSVERGIRQGCPLSPLLFIVAVEILAKKIRNSSEIEGIKIGEHTEGNSFEQTSKIKQFADDTTLKVKNEEDVKQALDIVQAFGEFSGLHLNKQKSEGIWLGARKWDRGRVHDIPMKDTIKS